MSEIAHAEYDNARKRQLDRNDARDIRNGVEAAQGNPARAGVRWPFELIQNAQDAGPRDQASFVEVDFLQQGGNLVVSHNGSPFVAQELAALLSGGSSKEIDDEETTGRFGTGFLSTHALATRVDVEGILKTDSGMEGFCIKLDRAGDEEAIAENIRAANAALVDAQSLPATAIADRPTAAFTYYAADPAVAEMGLDRLELAIPYLYATCDKLGQIHVRRPDKSASFQPERNPGQVPEEIDGFLLRRNKITVSRGETTQQFTALRIGSKDAAAGLLVVLEHGDGQRHRVCLPGPEFPKVFVKFPLTGTGFLPFGVVLDGRFRPQKERDSIMLDSDDKALIRDALSALPALVRYALESGWQNAPELARIAIPKQLLTGETGSGEPEWWKKVIPEIAEATAAQPIIETAAGFLPALAGAGEHASFPVSAVNATGQTPVDADSLRRLADRVIGRHLPVPAIAPAWEAIALEWEKLELPVERLGLDELTNWVKAGRQSLADLPLSGDRFQWLADLFLLVADLPEGVNPAPLLNGLVPNQHSQLRPMNTLQIDDGIPERVKDIAAAVGIDLRAELIHPDLMRAVAEPGYEPAQDLIRKLPSYTEVQAVDLALAVLAEKTPSDTPFNEMSDLSALRAAAALATYLAAADDNTLRLRKCPLLTAEDKVVRLENNLQILAPVSHWPESARPYTGLYTQNRVLSARYADNPEFSAALPPLIERNLVFPAPLYKAPRPELDGDLLKAMAAPGADTEGVTVRNQPFGQIAFLSSEVMQRCGRSLNLATLLLDFVLNVAAKEDTSWSETSLVSGYREREPLTLSIPGALWPFELKVRSWIPVTDEAEEITGQAQASEANLRPLLDPAWLQGNPQGIDLLHRVFGFRRITLMLENLDAEVEDSLEQLLQTPDLVKAAAANLDAVKIAVANPEAVQVISEARPEEIQEILAAMDVRKRQTEVRIRNNAFGHAVQAAVKAAVESPGLNLKLKLVDSGFDYEVFPDDSSFSFEVGSYLLEVKATVSKDVRLTPKQAETASKEADRFVLCVVDLSGFPEAHSKTDWSADDVIPYAKIVANIGGRFAAIYQGVTGFADAGKPVHLRNEEQLRYGVSADLWGNGVSIAEWVKSLKTAH